MIGMSHEKVCHLLDRVFAHDLVSKPGSIVEPKVSNFMRVIVP